MFYYDASFDLLVKSSKYQYVFESIIFRNSLTDQIIATRYLATYVSVLMCRTLSF